MTEMAPRLTHDASASTKAISFQHGIALKKCFELVVGQSVVIEKFGDVTVPGQEQIETKQEQGKLTDSSISFWNTLKNWMKPEFEHTQLPSLIFLTTQEYGTNTKLKLWNDSSQAARLKILQDIHDEAVTRHLAKKGDSNQKESEVFLIMKQLIGDEARDIILQSVVGKIWISADSDDFSATYEYLAQRECKTILEGKRSDFLNSLLGFIISPPMANKTNWEITYQEFHDRVQALTPQFSKGTTQFPQKFYASQPSKPEEERLMMFRFVEKLHDINYSAVVLDAIGDYYYASKTISEEFGAYEIEEGSLSVFVGDTLRRFQTEYRQRSRNCTEPITDSQNFYDEFSKASPDTFPGLELPSPRFRNGVMHIQLDDASQTLRWRLENNG